MQSPIGLELAHKGHNVTVITAFKETNPPPNYHQVMVDNIEIWENTGQQRPNIFTTTELTAEKFHANVIWPGTYKLTEAVFESKEVKTFLETEHKFDLVTVQLFFSESFYMLAHKYQAPLVLVSSFGNCMKHNMITRNPLQLATVTAELLTLEDPTTFLGRFRNWYFTMYEFVWWKYWYLEKQEKLVKKYLPGLPEPVPSLYDVQMNTSLLLMNGHFSFDTPAAYLPNIVEVGGLHLTKSMRHLPEDLRKILDDSKHGVIYMSLGSNVRSVEMSEGKRNAFINVFQSLNHTVIWKWEDERLENKPDNVFIRNWLPQKEILAHPSVKLFISHGGMISTQEAIFHGVPIIGIPVYSDQYNNLLIAQNIGIGKILKYQDINENTLRNLLLDVLNNESYSIEAKKASLRFKDRPLSALDTAMFWIEYVIRYKGASHMKNPALNLSWLAYTMLDVYIFVFLLASGFILVVVKLLVLILFLLKLKNKSKKTKKL